MRESLAWSKMKLQAKIETLVEAVRQTRSGTPRQNTRTLDKLDRWESQLEHILKMMEKIELELGPILEENLEVDLSDDELLKIAMFQPSTKNLFLEIEAHFVRNEPSVVDFESLGELCMVPEMAKVLGLMGDAAISMAIIHHLWRPSMREVGLLTQRRADVVSNENMASLCDEWNLYDYRIHFDPPAESKSEMQHIKGTLIEAVYGITYVRYGFSPVKEQAAHLLNLL
ncbi:hypothetical protein EU538_03505 [Candidatus Thorarchaeota archaeon]|nr:MAG: hypothetical protein EU538_03505 [Candidatus Thorarchaeota archaeon]